MPQLFLVPQFIETEDKIFGPISTRQFIILIVGGILIFICYKLLVLWLFIPAAIVLLGLIIVFAFVKINGQSFHYFFLNIIQTFKNPRLRVWLRAVGPELFKPTLAPEEKPSQVRRKPLTSSRLTELSLIVDTGGVFKPLEK